MGESSEREIELIKQGWTKRFVANEPRLTEMVELYQSMGHEVHLEPLPPVNCDSASDESEECRACFKGVEDRYKFIYTRPKKGDGGKDNLW